MEITAEITGIEYKPFLTHNLIEISLAHLDINSAPPSFLLVDGQRKIAVSKWVSPKRTRSYPYERVYNTLTIPKRVTIIPVVKDEGTSGDRDFLQWDTISLMSLLEVFVIPSYYNDAAKHRTRTGKISVQKFDNAYVLAKIREIASFHSSALHWNLKELREIGKVVALAKSGYSVISQKTGVKMHGESGLDLFAQKIELSLNDFMVASRMKAQQAQRREFLTLQPKEALSSETKGKITITNYLGGKYFFTCDETKIENGTVFLIEAKHSARAKFPSLSDIKDGLLKMILYRNLKNLRVSEQSLNYKPVLRLTSNSLNGKVSSDESDERLEEFTQINRCKLIQFEFFQKLFAEARYNNFVLEITGTVNR